MHTHVTRPSAPLSAPHPKIQGQHACRVAYTQFGSDTQKSKENSKRQRPRYRTYCTTSTSGFPSGTHVEPKDANGCDTCLQRTRDPPRNAPFRTLAREQGISAASVKSPTRTEGRTHHEMRQSLQCQRSTEGHTLNMIPWSLHAHAIIVEKEPRTADATAPSLHRSEIGTPRGRVMPVLVFAEIVA